MERAIYDHDLAQAWADASDTSFDGAPYKQDYREDAGFCNEDNMANSAMYLNNALSLLGISSPIEDMLKMADKALPLTPVTISQVFNCMYTLLRLRQDAQQQLERKADDLAVSLSQEHRLAAEKKRLKDRVDQLERETALCQAREKSLKENTDKEKAKWNLERQETRKQLLALQGKDTQYLHEMRKKEREYERLKQTLQQYIAEKKVASRRATELLNSVNSSTAGGSRLPRAAVPATPLRNKQSDEDIFRGIVASYERKQEVLREENKSLRQTILTIRRTIAQAIPDSKEPIKSDDQYLDMPVGVFRRTLEKQVEKDVHALKELTSRPAVQVPEEKASTELPPSLAAILARAEAMTPKRADGTSDLGMLRKKLEEQAALLENQEKLVSLALNTVAHPEDSPSQKGSGRSVASAKSHVPKFALADLDDDFEKENLDSNLDFLPHDTTAAHHPHRYPASVSLLSPINSP